jgi:hypothetical protein
MTQSAPRPEPSNAPQPQRSEGVRPSIVRDGRSDDSEWPCWVVSRFDGLHIRERPSKESRFDGRLNAGQSLPASCRAERGRPYPDCGGSEWWIPVPYEGRTDYVAWACVDWYTSDTGPGDEGPGFVRG